MVIKWAFVLIQSIGEKFTSTVSLKLHCCKHYIEATVPPPRGPNYAPRIINPKSPVLSFRSMLEVRT